MDLKPGSRWASQVCDVEVVVVRGATDTGTLECGGHAMVPQGEPGDASLVLDPAFAEGSPIGKRFIEADLGLEVLITKAGAGSLSVGGTALTLKDAKPLPSSD
jgi:hypothetical protein